LSRRTTDIRDAAGNFHYGGSLYVVDGESPSIVVETWGGDKISLCVEPNEIPALCAALMELAGEDKAYRPDGGGFGPVRWSWEPDE
jgi:hypothetical protein